MQSAPDEGSVSADRDPSPGRDASHRVHPLPQGEREEAYRAADFFTRASPHQALLSTAPCPMSSKQFPAFDHFPSHEKSITCPSTTPPCPLICRSSTASPAS